MSNRTYGAWDRPPPPVPPPHDRTVSLANQPDSCTMFDTNTNSTTIAVAVALATVMLLGAFAARPRL